LALPALAQENQLAFNADRIRAVAAAGGITCGAGGLAHEDFDGANSSTNVSGTSDLTWTTSIAGVTADANSTTITDTHFVDDDLSLVNTSGTANADLTFDVGGGASDDIYVAFTFKFTAVAGSTDNNAKYYLAHAQADGGTPGDDDGTTGTDVGLMFKLVYQTATTDFTASMISGSEFGTCGSTVTGITVNKIYIVQMKGDNAANTCGWEIWDCGTNGTSCSSLSAQTDTDDPGVTFKDVAFGVVGAPSVFDDAFTLYFGFVDIDSTGPTCD
jgi:hypothetical protein